MRILCTLAATLVLTALVLPTRAQEVSTPRDLPIDAFAQLPEGGGLGRAPEQRMDIVGIVEHGPGSSPGRGADQET